MSSVLDITVSSMVSGPDKSPVTVIHADGHVDASNAGDIEDAAMNAINGGAGNVLLDMSKVSFMSSAGFRSIHKIYQVAVTSGDLKQAVDSF
jgi:anti-anti-sigma factor